MSPALIKLAEQAELFPISDQERKLTWAEVNQYLQTADIENPVKAS